MTLSDAIVSILEFIINYFDIIAVIILALIFAKLLRVFEKVWLFWKQSLHKENLKWAILEIKVPREVQRTPKAMEQFLIGIHNLRNSAGNFIEKYIEGEVTLWWSLEIVSFGGKIHLYVRTPKKYVKMLEAGLYAQYPNVEVAEAEDYMEHFPKTTQEIYEKNFDLFGGEVMLKKDNGYPIRTYEEFFKATFTEKPEAPSSTIDPLSALIEVFSSLDKEENVFLQILIRPGDEEKCREPAQKIIDKILGKKEEKKSEKNALGEFLGNLIMAPVREPQWGAPKEEKKEEKKVELTGGQKEVLKAIEQNMAKPYFETVIRYMYYAPKAIYSTNFARRGLFGALNQYVSPALNGFKSNSAAETRGRWIYFPHFFVKQRVEAKKQRILMAYKNRIMPEESDIGRAFTSNPFYFNTKSKVLIMSTAEIATIFHIPAEQVLTAPHLKRTESKRLGPPAGLPIFVEGE